MALKHADRKRVRSAAQAERDRAALLDAAWRRAQRLQGRNALPAVVAALARQNDQVERMKGQKKAEPIRTVRKKGKGQRPRWRLPRFAFALVKGMAPGKVHKAGELMDWFPRCGNPANGLYSKFNKRCIVGFFMDVHQLRRLGLVQAKLVYGLEQHRREGELWLTASGVRLQRWIRSQPADTKFLTMKAALRLVEQGIVQTPEQALIIWKAGGLAKYKAAGGVMPPAAFLE